ncbi:MAG: SRPBCC family protein [Propionibacteriaceae bacterium]|nr:SRPBCC family protein [Propionibacteriaceae bacterium]
MEWTTTVEIASRLDTVWAAVADPLAWPAWSTDVTSIIPTGPDHEPCVGARYEVAEAWWQVRDQEIVISDRREQELFAFTAPHPRGRVVFEYRLRQLEEAVGVEYRVRTEEVHAPSEVLGGNALERQHIELMAALRDHCESH